MKFDQKPAWPSRLADDENHHDSDFRPKSTLPPPNYNSRPVKIKLMMLVAMLLGTMLMMREAGKPKYWTWIAPAGKPPTAQNQTVKLAFEGDSDNPNPPSEEHRREGPGGIFGANQNAENPQPTDSPAIDPENAQPLHSPGSRSETETESGQLSGAGHASGAASNNDDFPEAAAEFWGMTANKMTTVQLRDFFHFLRLIRSGQPLPDDPEMTDAFEKLVEIIKDHQRIFHRDMLDRLPLAIDGSEEKTALANRLFESQQLWEQAMLPAFESKLAGKDVSAEHRHRFQQLQQILDPIALKTVQDKSALGWKGDTAAWLRLWELVAGSDFGDPMSVTHLELSGQPDFYRGKPVAVKGWVGTARQRKLTDSQLGIPHYYELWVRPHEIDETPYCVYVANLPADFPAVSETFQELNLRVQVTGLFFKLRAYEDRQSNVGNSPVIVAKNVELLAEPANPPADFLKWSPSWMTWAVILLSLPLLAAGIAWAVYRSSTTRRTQPGQSTTEKVQTRLKELANDPSIQTDEEKIKELYGDD